jgi:uncharacterized membrane protein YphA (DoxX/SURF4 family)
MFREPAEPKAALSLVSAMEATGYMLPLLRVTEIFAGALLVAGALVPLALIILAPVVVNIFAFHLFLSPQYMPLVLSICALEVLLAWQHRRAFSPLFSIGDKAMEAGS